MTKEKMQPIYFKLSDQQIVANCIHVLQTVREDKAEAGLLEVIIQPAKNKRSLAQNRLYWKWVHQWSDKLGWTEEYTHHFFKYKFLMMIYYRADDQYAAMCDAVKVLKSLDKGVFDKLAAHVIRQTSTTTASKDQMTEYLDKIYLYCYSKGVLLFVPDDLKWVRSDKRGS
ncbi:recombination protein [Shewanella phage vB_SbaS_Y11]|nr:recombination protein [Shewanella phage vB_SbaS_Y11]